MKKFLNKVHRNIPQMLVFLVDAVITVALFGRGTGKTFGVTSLWVFLRAKVMPRSTGFICSPSYTHLIDTIIPEMEKGWMNMGLKENVHYWKYSAPPPALKIPEPYLKADKPKYFIYWLNGSVTKLVSLDRKALVNSKSFDYGAIVEGRKCKARTVTDDLMPTLRGGETNAIYRPDGTVESEFQDHYQHHSLLIESDLPKTVEERWILSYRKKSNKNRVNQILQLQKIRYELAKNTRRNVNKIKELDATVNEMREDLVHVCEASTLDNIHVLGIRTLKNLRQSLTPRDWRISVLGILDDEIEDCFYAALSKEKHGYNGISYAVVDKAERGEKHTWRWDKDLRYNQPLYMAMDCGGRFNCFNLFQYYNAHLKKVNYMWLESEPGATTNHQTLTREFCQYYEGYPNKVIHVVYNNTMLSGIKGGHATIIDDISEILLENDWDVREEYVGQAETHDVLHNQWNQLFKGELELKFSYNLQNCDLWYDCCKDAPILITDSFKGQRLKKNKKSEKPGSGIPPHQATHATEGPDTMLQYILGLENSSGFTGSAVSG
jgi:hypothetical protein